MNKLASRAAVVGIAVGVACAALGCGEVEHGNVGFAVSPDGHHVVFAAADGDLYLLDLGTWRVSSLTRTEGTESTPAFSPDGRAVISMATIRAGSPRVACSPTRCTGPRPTARADHSLLFALA